MRYQEEKQLAGNRDQLIRVSRYQMMDGKANGAELLEVQNRSGLHFHVNLSRGMDIPYMDFNGQNIGFVSACGIVAPEYFDDKGLGFLKGFTAGLMTTCGLKYIGGPCEYEGKEYGLHGNINNTPATEVSYRVVEDGDDPYVLIRGRLEDAQIFDDKLSLEREIRCDYQDAKVTVADRVTNDGYQTVRHMILYHCNIGYPMLSPESEVFIPTTKVIARTPHAEEGIDRWMYTEQPDPAYEEMCYYHTLKDNGQGGSSAAIFNPSLNLGIAIEPQLATLDHFLQWKMMGARDYVMGLEPCNSTLDGIEDAIAKGTMKYLEPGQSVEYKLAFRILQGRDAFEDLKKTFA